MQQFKQEISLALFVNGNNTKEFENVKREFERSFEDRVDSHLYKDQSLEKIREISFADFHEDKLMIYLEFFWMMIDMFLRYAVELGDRTWFQDF